MSVFFSLPVGRSCRVQDTSEEIFREGVRAGKAARGSALLLLELVRRHNAWLKMPWQPRPSFLIGSAPSGSSQMKFAVLPLILKTKICFLYNTVSLVNNTNDLSSIFIKVLSVGLGGTGL